MVHRQQSPHFDPRGFRLDRSNEQLTRLASTYIQSLIEKSFDFRPFVRPHATRLALIHHRKLIERAIQIEHLFRSILRHRQ